jgi:hypothetical protein
MSWGSDKWQLCYYTDFGEYGTLGQCSKSSFDFKRAVAMQTWLHQRKSGTPQVVPAASWWAMNKPLWMQSAHDTYVHEDTAAVREAWEATKEEAKQPAKAEEKKKA